MASTAVLQDRLTEAIQTAQYREATDTFCELVAVEGQPLQSVIGHALGAAAPLALVPSHQVILPNGAVRSVNYDHTILGWRAAVTLRDILPTRRSLLPVVQAIWYLPQGLDIWDQLNCEFPGHYAISAGCNQRFPSDDGELNRFDGAAWRKPEPFFSEPEVMRNGTIPERLDRFEWAVAEGDKQESYGLFLGLIEDLHNPAPLEERLLLAGIVDLQDTLVNRRTYQNIGHKALRARSLVDLGRYLGWDNARDVTYTVIPDLACAPRLHGLWTEIGGVMGVELRGVAVQKRSAPLNARDMSDLTAAILWGAPHEVNNTIIGMYRRGHGSLDVADAIVVIYQRHLLERVEHPVGFNELMHAFDYTNVVNTWIREYDSPHHPRGPLMSARFINDAILYNSMFPRDPAAALESRHDFRSWADGVEASHLLAEIERYILEQDSPRVGALIDSYLVRSTDRDNLIASIIYAACHFQNDPHIMRNCASCLEEYRASQSPWRDDILRGFGKYQSRYIKRAKTFDAYKRHEAYFNGNAA